MQTLWKGKGMADLTEQWKKGELPEGWYYIEGNRVEGIYAYTAEYLNNMYRPRNGERIIAKVPSYEEWQSMDRLEKIMLQERARLNKQVTELLEENTKLKELLKVCRECVDENLEFSQSIGRNRIQPRNKGLLKRIDEVLK